MLLEVKMRTKKIRTHVRRICYTHYLLLPIDFAKLNGITHGTEVDLIYPNSPDGTFTVKIVCPEKK